MHLMNFNINVTYQCYNNETLISQYRYLLNNRYTSNVVNRIQQCIHLYTLHLTHSRRVRCMGAKVYTYVYNSNVV